MENWHSKTHESERSLQSKQRGSGCGLLIYDVCQSKPFVNTKKKKGKKKKKRQMGKQTIIEIYV